MSSSRALVNCAVLSLKDTHFVYACCKICLSKLTQESILRLRCLKCGLTCDVHNAEYRYRLSLKVSRDKCIFGVTVFGGCLNPFFGVTADCLQRFLNSRERDDRLPVRDLLIKAVEDCFIGKSFILGFKAFSLDAENHLLGKPTSVGLGECESAHFVACQIISPNEAFQGITVFAYLQRLLRTRFQLSGVESPKAVCQSQDKDSVISSFENTLPLCIKSYLENSIGLPNFSPWLLTSNISLLFSPEKTSGYSSQHLTVDNVKCIPSQYVCIQGHKHNPECPTIVLSQSSQSPKSTDGVQCMDKYESDGIYNKHSASNESTLCSVDAQFYASGSCACGEDLKHKKNMSCASKSGRPVCNPRLSLVGSSWQENVAFFHNSPFIRSGKISSFALEEAPLSETLGAFVNTQPQLSEIVDKCLPRPDRKLEKDPATQGRENCVLKDNVLSKTNVTAATGSPCPYQSVLTPLHNITNVIGEKASAKSMKRKHKKRKILFANPCPSGSLKKSPASRDCNSCSFDMKDMVAKRRSLTKNPVNMHACRLQNNQRSQLFQDIAKDQDMEEKLSSCAIQGEEYNCSADLFYQSSLDVNIPVRSEKSVSDPDEKRKDFLLDAGSECEVFNSFHFAPSLQSTPIAHPHYHRSNAQGHAISKQHQDSQHSKKKMTLANRIRRRETCSKTIQGPNAEKAELHQTQTTDFAYLSETEGRGDVKCNHENTVLPNNINEWSRDLFDHSF